MRSKSNISISIDPELIKWIDEQVKVKKYATRSHAIEYALYQLKHQ